jgi:hypothetical protein
VTGKWKLAKDFVSYEHSSASFYEEGIVKHFEPRHFKDLWIECMPSKVYECIRVSRRDFFNDGSCCENPDGTQPYSTYLIPMGFSNRRPGRSFP